MRNNVTQIIDNGEVRACNLSILFKLEELKEEGRVKDISKWSAIY